MNSLADSLSLGLSLLVSFDPMLWQIVARSLLVSLSATTIAMGLGVILGSVLAVAQFRWKPLALVLLNTYVAVPAVVVGLVVYVLLSRSGPLGHLGWLFSLEAMIMAQTILVIPLVAIMTRQTLAAAHQRLGEPLQSMGAPTLLAGAILLVHERHAMAAVAATAFGRAISEVGTVMIVGGNIDGFTRVMTTAIALETSKGDLPLAIALGVVLLSVVILLNGLVAGLRRLQPRESASGAE